MQWDNVLQCRGKRSSITYDLVSDDRERLGRVEVEVGGRASMESTCQISAIVPVYNQEDRIADCLDSLLAQEGVMLEVICVNDGSTDHTGEVLEAYRARDERIVLIDQPNAGAGAARNVAISQAQGEFISFCDADDIIPSPTVYVRLYQAARENGASIAGGSFSLSVDGDDAVETLFDGLLFGYAFQEEGFVEYADYQFDYGFTRFIYARALLCEYGLRFPEEQRFEDPVFLVQALWAAGSFYAIPDIVYLCNIEHAQQDHEWTTERALSLLRGIKANLMFAIEHALPELHALTLRRLNEEYCGIFKLPVLDMRVLDQLIELNGMVNWEWVDQLRWEGAKGEPLTHVIKPLERILNDYIWRSSITETVAFRVARYGTALQRKAARFMNRRKDA